MSECDTPVQSSLAVFGIGTRVYLDVVVPHFHVCNRSGPEAGPVFYQYEAWPIREMVAGHVCRLVESEIRARYSPTDDP